MNIKKLSIVGATSLLLLTSTSPVLAAPAKGQGSFGAAEMINQIQKSENQASKAAQKQDQNLTNLKTRADKAIDQRITSLNNLLSRVQNAGRLDATEKSALSSDIQSDISGLTTLKAKIGADTDISTAREDAKKIVSDYRIYAMFMPRMRLLITIDNLQALAARLSSLMPKIQSLADNLKSQGKDTSKIQSLIDDINNQLSTINSKLSADKTTVMGVSISTQDPQATFVQVRKDLSSVRSAFAQIRHDIGQMRVDFQSIIKVTGNFNTKNSTGSSTPNSTSSATP